MCEYPVEASEEGTADVIDASPAKDEGKDESESTAEGAAVGEGGGSDELARLLRRTACSSRSARGQPSSA